MSKFDKIIPKGSVPNCQLQIANRYDNRWFKCKLKPPKNGQHFGGTGGTPLAVTQETCLVSLIVSHILTKLCRQLKSRLNMTNFTVWISYAIGNYDPIRYLSSSQEYYL